MSQNESDESKISAEQAQVVTPPLSVVVSDDETDSGSTSQELRKVVDALQNTVKPNGGDQFTPQQDTSSQVADSTEEIKDLSDEVSAVEIASAKEEAEIVPPTPGTPPFSSEEEALEDDAYTGNNVTLDNVDIKLIQPNLLEPREQEKADEPMLRGIRHLFNNRFMKAKRLFETKASSDPLYALGLGSMAFLKAILTSSEAGTKDAIDVLTTTYNIATAQIDLVTKKSVGDSIMQYMTSYYNYIKFARASGGLPSSPKPATLKTIKSDQITFASNGVLRAHVAKAESCLQIAILQLLQENVMSYVKCGINIRRAYASYSLVWQEYKRMGQLHHDYIDEDTLSGIQFGIGAVHLVLSCLPQKVLRVVSAFGWKADKHLGFALLKLCLEGKRIRSPMASLMLLAYYTTLTSFCPQILSDEYTQPAIETLLDAQRTYPNSAFFLYFAGRVSRLARNLILSSQSFTYAIEISKNEWAEVEVLQLCSYENAFNHMMQHQWEEAGTLFNNLYKDRYWSPAILRYLNGACLEMAGQHTEAILAYAQVPELVGSKTHSTALIEKYIVRKVTSFQESGYQDMSMSLGAFEFIYLFVGFDFMDLGLLEKSINTIDGALGVISEAEQSEFTIRTRELLPDTPPPQYFNQRGVLLLMKAALLNAIGQYKDAIIHLNWIIDQKESITTESWLVPFAYWESGVTSWGLDNKQRSRALWETALSFNSYDFEYRLSMRVNLAITKAEELGFVKEKPVAPKHKTLAKKEGDSIEGGQPRTEYNVEDDIHRVPISYINMHL